MKSVREKAEVVNAGNEVQCEVTDINIRAIWFSQMLKTRKEYCNRCMLKNLKARWNRQISLKCNFPKLTLEEIENLMSYHTWRNEL